MNILDEQPPSIENFVKRIEFCAKSLAYGVSQDIWSPAFQVFSNQNGEEWQAKDAGDYRTRFHTYLYSNSGVWKGMHPRVSFLEAFGYVDKKSDAIRVNKDTPVTEYYILTEKAFLLLETPAKPPEVFISYRRMESSAFALLIVARLQSRGMENPYIDMRMEGGQIWENELENAINHSNAFISIFCSADSFSYNVLKEIAWASRNPNMKFIPVQQTNPEIKYPIVNLRDYVADAQDISLQAFISKHHVISVNEQSARGYNGAIVEILSSLGYAPR